MKKTKYITSGGLAFSEKEDMDKLQRYSNEGWHVKGFKLMGYTLEKGHRSDYIYSIDYRSLAEGDEDEYMDVFASAGWTHIASSADIHLFRAQAGTEPIYTDRDTTVEKYRNSAVSVGKAAVPLVLLTVLAWIGAVMSTGMFNVLTIAAVILTACAVPTAWTALTAYQNKWKAEGKKKTANLAMALPFLILLLGIAAFVWNSDSTGGAIRMLTAMLIGAIAFPAVVWAVMTLSQSIRVKQH
ncbi:DUF2812 domain-containing protein [Edaphobacillus lindanitolerans]|uniref:DUF2812 domain-containing protein n=1 Tax=Edaphobacillus lindanitolerans TaxID=550447 RepID=A0A1U7PN09_9BACI|nr:DUF2812 domain-containing protein [Edaphobacillus lindanitolerans]SIT71974.1 Protein of unknown function [Edaphobacillus lindanitolerans]